MKKLKTKLLAVAIGLAIGLPAQSETLFQDKFLGNPGFSDQDEYNGLKLAANDSITPDIKSSTTEDASSTNNGQPSLAEMSQKANNPLSDVWIGLVQNDYSIINGDAVNGDRKVNSLKIQPVMPIPLFNGKWNLIIRPIFNILSLPVKSSAGSLLSASPSDIRSDSGLGALASDPYGRSWGMGDPVLLTLLGPNRNDGFIWGAGISQIFPLATDDIFGQGKYQIGPAALAVSLGNESGGLGLKNWNIGVLAQQWWSVAGDHNRADTSHMNIQYFINWRLNETSLIGMTPNITVNWEADSGQQVSFPVGLGYIGMFKLGPMPVKWGIEVQKYIVSPNNVGMDWNIKFFIAPITLNPFK